MENQLVFVVDFGGQYNQLIARRVRDFNVYCEIVPYTVKIEDIKKRNPVGIIFTGGPNSVYAEHAPKVDPAVFELGVPVLGICYGAQLIAQMLGGTVSPAGSAEYGKQPVSYQKHALFAGLASENICWMSHFDAIRSLPEGFQTIATTPTCPHAAMENAEKRIYGVQFHPEVVHTVDGLKILKNFLYDICGATGDWSMDSFAEDQIEKLRAKIGDRKVLCALSGGVDSAVCAAMIHKAAPDNLVCVFVDHGLLRKNEAEEVVETFKNKMGMNLIKVDASERFLTKLAGVTEPEKKRKIIGEEFIRVFEEESKKIGAVDFLVQGTIYPDVVESGLGSSAVIKSHHNVGGLPSVVDFKEIIEPLRELFKDEVRKVGFELGMPEKIVMRQPFPGPGLAIRCIGEITKEKLDILRDADLIFREEIALAGLNEEIWQYFAVLTDIRSVGVMGDARTYDYMLALRAVTSIDAMTANWAHIPPDILEKISTRIINEVAHINRIVYDITSKPPATIEWE